MDNKKFNRNILTLITGTSIAQAIPIIISPILTRIYTPEDFGILTLFLAITYIFSSVVSLRYELAIVLPRKDEDALNICALSLLIVIIISLFLLFIIMIFYDNILSLLNNKDIGTWLYFLPIAIFLIGVLNILTYFNIRKKYYKDISKSKIIKSIIASILQLCIGFIKPGPSGLIIGQILSNFSANLKLLNNLQNTTNSFKISKLKMIALALKYKNLPKFSMWAILANKLSYNLNDILISLFFSVVTLGHYSIVQRILGMPSSLVGSAVGQVFFQSATQEKYNTGNIKKTFTTTIKKLLLMAVPFFLLLNFWIEDIFSFVFGNQWAIAGEYAKIMIPFFFVRFIIASISTTEIIMEKQTVGLIFNISLLIIFVLTIIFFKAFHFKVYLFYCMIFTTIAYIIYGFTLYSIAKNKH